MAEDRGGDPVACPSHAPTAPADLRTFLRTLYDQQPGWLEIAYIDGDPRVEHVKRAGWERWRPADAERIARRIEQLAAQYGNVYVSACLYTRQHRSRDTALPSRVVFLDDAPAGGDYSMVVQTSASSHHAYYLLDQAISPDERNDLSRRAAAALGADPSGADITQIVRVPGSWNTKNHGRHAVRLELLTDRRYTADELSERWPALPARSAHTGKHETNTALWEAAEPHIRQIEALMKSRRMRCVKPTTPLHKILIQNKAPFERDGADNSRSNRRCTVAHGLRVHGYPDEEIAAILWMRCDWGHSEQKGEEWLKVDIQRCIDHAHERYPKSQTSPTRYMRTAQAPAPQVTPHPAAPPAPRRGRKRALTPETYLAWLHRHTDAGGIVLRTRHECAAALGVSVGTLDRVERDLEQRLLIERRTDRSRRRSWVALLGAIKIAPQAPVEQHIYSDPTPPLEAVRTPCAESETQHGGTPPPPGGTLAPRPAALGGPEALPPSLPIAALAVQLVGDVAAAAEAGQPLPAVELAAPVEQLVALDQPAGDDQADDQPPADDQAPAAGDELADNQAASEQAPAAGDELHGPGGAVAVLGGAAWVPPVAASWYGQLVEHQADGHSRPRPAQDRPWPGQDRPLPGQDRAGPVRGDPGLRELVREALDAYGSNLRRVRRYLRDNSTRAWSDEAIERCYRAELRQRQRERAEAATQARIAKMGWSELKGRARSAGQRAAQLQRQGARDAGWWLWYAGQLEAEISRRTPPPSSTATATPVRGRRRQRPQTLELELIWGDDLADDLTPGVTAPTAMPVAPSAATPRSPQEGEPATRGGSTRGGGVPPNGAAVVMRPRVRAGAPVAHTPPVLAERQGLPPAVVAATLGEDMASMLAAHAACEELRAQIRAREAGAGSNVTGGA